MHRFIKRLLWVAATLGLGAVAYALMRAEGERVLAQPRRGEQGAGPRPAETPETPDLRAVETASPRCAAVTQGGSRCVREALPGSDHCWQHG